VLKTGREVKDKKVYFPDCDKYIEQSVIFDRSNKLLICILRDVTEQEIVRIKKDKMSKQTINIVNNVIENQMRAVQEIALLLGETAAETKIAITNLKESLIDE
ncbi:MAG: histidine kinase, partial [Oscillospiraceae bacterium]